jgi:hypothetical protein
MRQQMVALAEDNLKNHERVFDQIRLRTEQGVAVRQTLNKGSPSGAGAQQPADRANQPRRLPAPTTRALPAKSPIPW